MRGSWLVLLLVPILASCEGILPPRSCTLIGCSDGLSVQLVDLPPGAYTLEVVLTGGETHTVECAQASDCPTHVFFPGVTAEELTLRLTTTTGSRVEVHPVVYTRQQPNGRSCPPVCWQAELTMRAS
jgi:hypothetical protein